MWCRYVGTINPPQYLEAEIALKQSMLPGLFLTVPFPLLSCLLVGCAAQPEDSNFRVWDGSTDTDTQIIYVCSTGALSYGRCTEDGVWVYESSETPANVRESN